MLVYGWLVNIVTLACKRPVLEMLPGVKGAPEPSTASAAGAETDLCCCGGSTSDLWDVF